ncbi:ran-binding protein 1 homolog c-like [Aristolochia californica]|uniref:ran-binding protein 1 homolog c-like n=1 Tax=Aristolochia californica TaxID=171875 RepID=UPI0035DD03CD
MRSKRKIFVSLTANTYLECNEEETWGQALGEEEDIGAQVVPIVRLEEVIVTTGEEEEDVLLDLKSKLYRFDKEGDQWKEHGARTAKLLKHKEMVNRKRSSFCIRFGSNENCRNFMELVEEIDHSQVQKDEKDNANHADDLIDKLSVIKS